MGWITIPAIGTKLGPCKEPCEHLDCMDNRNMANTPCEYCTQPIGYHTPFYQVDKEDGSKGLVHYICIEKYYEREEKRCLENSGS